MAADRGGNAVIRSVPKVRPRWIRQMLNMHALHHQLRDRRHTRQTAPPSGAMWVDIICILFTVQSERVVLSTTHTYGMQGYASNVFYPQNVPLEHEE